MEHLAGIELELDLGLADLLDGLGGVRLPFERAGLEARQALAHGDDDVVFDRPDAVGRVEVADVRVDPNDQFIVGGEGEAGAEAEDRDSQRARRGH
jgi:hypothetical protein